MKNWATTWQNLQNDLCTLHRLRSAWSNAKSDQSLLCALWVAKDPMLLHVDREDSEADLSLRWAHMSVCLFCHAAAQKLNREKMLLHINMDEIIVFKVSWVDDL